MKSPLPSWTIVLALSFVAVSAVYAGSATWNLNPTSGDWNTAANWTPNTVPNGPSDTATFDVSTITSISTSDQTEVDSIVFNPGASAYTITLASPQQEFLFITGTGIVNNSGVTQTFVSSDGGFFFHAFYFFNNATAGDLTVFYNPSFVGANGWFITDFLDSSNAGSCTIINADAPGGLVGWWNFSANRAQQMPRSLTRARRLETELVAKPISLKTRAREQPLSLTKEAPSLAEAED